MNMYIWFKQLAEFKKDLTRSLYPSKNVPVVISMSTVTVFSISCTGNYLPLEGYGLHGKNSYKGFVPSSKSQGEGF